MIIKQRSSKVNTYISDKMVDLLIEILMRCHLCHKVSESIFTCFWGQIETFNYIRKISTGGFSVVVHFFW